MAKDTKKQNEKEMAKLDREIRLAKEQREILLEEAESLKSIYKWSAPERIHEPKDRNWYVMVAGVALVIIVYAALTNNFGLIIAVIAVIFFIYALNTIPAKTVQHEVTNKGLKSHGQLFTWRTIDSFFVVRRGRHLLMNFEVRPKPTSLTTERVVVLKGEADLKKVVTYLVQHIDYLSSTEVGNNIFFRVTQGEYQPLIQFLLDSSVKTKDPKDSPKHKGRNTTEQASK
ncbi:MAG: hypothetical protein ACE5DX_01870 [Candidatus Dojkabacteria bacterium]